MARLPCVIDEMHRFNGNECLGDQNKPAGLKTAHPHKVFLGPNTLKHHHNRLLKSESRGVPGR